MRYQPRLKNGELVKLSWSLVLFRWTNPGMWPLDDNPTERDCYLDRALVVSGFLTICVQVQGGFHYLLDNLQDLDNFFAAVSPALLQTELIIRFVHMAMHKGLLKKLLQYFYAEIYVPEESDKRSFSRIKRQLLGPQLITVFYMATLLNYFYEFGMNIMAGRREMLFKQAYFFDHRKLPIYTVLISINFWASLLIVTMVFVDLNMLGEVLMHLNVCYRQLGKDLRSAAAHLLESKDKQNIAKNYRRELIKVLTRNIDLNHFAKEIEKQFTFRLFITFSFSAIILCLLLFKSYKNPAQNMIFIFWFIAKFIEQLSFGYLGSILYQTTNELDLMYFCGDWEQIIYCSQNVAENVKLMKLIVLSIELNSKPFSLTGLKTQRCERKGFATRKSQQQ
ncbi:hypothetical protein ACLKA7_010364 [Drosophila subpalustris]